MRTPATADTIDQGMVRPLLRGIGKTLLAIGAVGLASAAYVWVTLPDVRSLKTQNPTTTAFMKLRAGEDERDGKPPHFEQQWVSYGKISPALKRAVLVAEDAAFPQHDGIDYDELKAAIELDWNKGQFVRGASTITQQLAKNLYLSPSRNPYRKLAELFITRRLESELSKGRIFEIYLNVIEWGDGIWGAEAAAQAYFNEPASALTPEQSALLAGAIINPRVYSPAHPNKRLLNRQAIILRNMSQVTPPYPPNAFMYPAPVLAAPVAPVVLGTPK